MPRRAWLLPGRRQTLLLALLILAAGASLLLLPDRSTSYRAVATAVAPTDAPDCVSAAPDHVGDEEVRGRVAHRARVDDEDVARSTEVLAPPAGAVLAVAFEADTAYAAQRGAYTTVAESVSGACGPQAGGLLEDILSADQRLQAAEAAVRAAPVPTPPFLLAARDEAAAALVAVQETFDRQSSLPARSTTVAAAEALGSRRSGLEELAVPAGVVLCAALALAVLRVGWRRAAAPVPA